MDYLERYKKLYATVAGDVMLAKEIEKKQLRLRSGVQYFKMHYLI